MKVKNHIITAAALQTGEIQEIEISHLFTILSPAYTVNERYHPTELMIYNYTGMDVEMRLLTFSEKELEFDGTTPKNSFYDFILIPDGQVLQNDSLPMVDFIQVRGLGATANADLRITGVNYLDRGSRRDF